MVGLAVCATRRLGFPHVPPVLCPDNDIVDEMPVLGAGLHQYDVFLRFGRRNTVSMMARSLAVQILSKRRPLQVHFPPPYFPMTLYQVWWSVSTRALTVEQ